MAYTPMASSMRSMHQTMNGAEEEKFDSNYFVPNYPFKEPVFYVPRVPNIVKVPEPGAPKRQPPQGYDMRTLRKQLEFLTGEIEEKEETQNLLYTQNEQLWNYIQELMEANKANAQLMRGEVSKLHIELKNAHRERYNIAEKLQLARNSKQMLAELNLELQGAQLTVEEIERRKRDAENALLHAKEENSHLEEVLRSQQEEILGAHSELDAYRKRQVEEQALDLADDFFYTNKAVLRAAYYRFRAGVQKRFKLTRIASAMSSAYHAQLKHMYFQKLCAFLHRCRVAHLNVSRRRRESLTQCMVQWKVYAALEKYFKQSHRRVLLRRVFRAWRTEARETAYENWALLATQELHVLQFKRKFFHAWRKSTCFLYWHNPMVVMYEQQAQQHFTRKVFYAWRQASEQSKEDLQQKVEQVPKVVQWWHVRIWRELCESRWRRRGKLMRRFFRSLKLSVVEHAERLVTYKYAFTYWVSYKQRQALKQWIYHMRTRRMFITGHVKPTQHMGTKIGNSVDSWDRTYTTAGLQDTLLRDFNSTNRSNLYVDIDAAEGRADAMGEGYSPRPSTLLNTLHTPASYFDNTVTTHYTFNTINTGNTHTNSGVLLPQFGTKMANHRRGRAYNRWQQHKTLQVLSHMKKRWLRSSLLVLTYATKVLHTSRLNLQAGMQHYISHLAYRALLVWRENARRDRNRRRRTRFNLLSLLLNTWKAFTKETSTARRREEGIVALQSRQKQHTTKLALHNWRQATRTALRLAHCSEYLTLSNRYRHTRSYFNRWRAKWTHTVYWQLQKLKLECQTAKQLDELNRQAMEELETKHTESVDLTHMLQQQVQRLQKAIADANNLTRVQNEEISLREREKSDVLNALQTTQQELSAVQAQAAQMRQFEEVLIHELKMQEEERVILKHTADTVKQRVASESEMLRSEVAMARQQAMHAERQADSEVLRHQQEVHAVQREAELLQLKLMEKREHLKGLELESSGLKEGLSRVQSKLGEVSKDGAALIAENEALIRSRGSTVRVLRSNAGLAEARVAALKEVISDFEQETQRMQLSEVLEEDHSELNELIALQRQLESSLQHSLHPGNNHYITTYPPGTVYSHTSPASPSPGRSPTSRGVSLHRNLLSPSPADTPLATPALSTRKTTNRSGSPQGVKTQAGSRGPSPGPRSTPHSTQSTSSTYSASRSGGPGKRSLRADAPSVSTTNTASKPHYAKSDHAKLPAHTSTIAAPTPPTLTPHNNQSSSRAPVASAVPAAGRPLHDAVQDTLYAVQMAKMTNNLSQKGALDGSIFELLHQQDHLPRVSQKSQFTTSPSSSAVLPKTASREGLLSSASVASALSAPLSSSLPPPPRAHSPPRLPQPSLGLGSANAPARLSAEHGPATHSNVTHSKPQVSAGGAGRSASSAHRELHVSVPESSLPHSAQSEATSTFSPPQSPFRMSGAFPKSPPTFLTAALDSDSEHDEYTDEMLHNNSTLSAHGDILSRFESRPQQQAPLRREDYVGTLQSENLDMKYPQYQFRREGEAVSSVPSRDYYYDGDETGVHVRDGSSSGSDRSF
eukprot:gene7766-9274_t